MLDDFRKAELVEEFFNNEEPNDPLSPEEKQYWNLLLLEAESATLRLLARIVEADQQMEKMKDD